MVKLLHPFHLRVCGVLHDRGYVFNTRHRDFSYIFAYYVLINFIVQLSK